MLLGCCHCGGDPSESNPSASSVESIATEISTCAFGTCIGQVFPRRYSVTYNFGTTVFCAASYQGSFTLHFRGDAPPLSGVGGCFWTSDAKTLEYTGDPGNPCPSSLTRPRFVLTMYKNTVLSGSQSFRVRLSVNAGIFELVPGNLAIVSYLSMLSLPGTQLNCLSAFTLPLETASFGAPAFSTRLTGVNSHRGPSSVTLTPT